MGIYDDGIAIYRRPWPFFASPGWDERTPFIFIHCLQLGRYLYLSLELDTNRKRIPQDRSARIVYQSFCYRSGRLHRVRMYYSNLEVRITPSLSMIPNDHQLF